MKRIIFISWERYHRRSELLADHFNATIHYIYFGQKGKILQAPLRYLMQGLQTLRIFYRRRPEIVFVQNPPIFSVLVTFLYAGLFGAQYIIDSHSGAFVSIRWRWSLWLHRMLSHKALMTFVHNKSQEKIVERWGCRYCVLGFTPGDYSFGKYCCLPGQFNVAVISNFNADEPFDVVFKAASRLPDVDFYITGNSKQIAPALLKLKPKNCHLTGYLSYDRYVGLLREVDVILTLAVRDHTLLMGGFEAVSLGTPLITSDWPILKDYFSLGTIHVANTVEGICAGVHRARSEHDTLKQDILRLRNRLEDEWEHKFDELQYLLSEYQGKNSRIHRNI